MAPKYRTQVIYHRASLGRSPEALEARVDAVLDGVPQERIVSITHTYKNGITTVLIVLRVDEDADATIVTPVVG